jgi:hypothetical protein
MRPGTAIQVVRACRGLPRPGGEVGGLGMLDSQRLTSNTLAPDAATPSAPPPVGHGHPIIVMAAFFDAL